MVSHGIPALSTGTPSNCPSIPSKAHCIPTYPIVSHSLLTAPHGIPPTPYIIPSAPPLPHDVLLVLCCACVLCFCGVRDDSAVLHPDFLYAASSPPSRGSRVNIKLLEKRWRRNRRERPIFVHDSFYTPAVGFCVSGCALLLCQLPFSSSMLTSSDEDPQTTHAARPLLC